MKTATPTILLLALLLCAPAALAHVETFSQAKTVQAGPYTLFLSPRPETVFANTTMTLSALVSKSDTGTPTREVKATLVVGGPNEFTRRAEMRDDRTGLLVASMLLPHRGNYSIRVLVTDPQNETHAADLEIEAYPDLPVRIRSGDAEQDVFTNESAKLIFEVVNRTSLDPDPTLGDLRVLFEHWDDSHTVMYGVKEVEGKHLGEGKWEFDHTFRDRGMYHIKFASRAGGFTYTDVPVLHLYAIPRPKSPDENQVPGASVPAALAGLLVVALLLARRRGA